VRGPIVGSEAVRGGQAAGDAALAAFDVSGYARSRNQVDPVASRGASRLSPYIRHGLLTLPDVWRHVDGGPKRDVSKFRDELLWQEYARHWYAHLGRRTAQGIRRRQAEVAPSTPGWDRTMACVDRVVSELETDGWLVNQTRMWLASQWAVRHGFRWQEGEDEFFAHLLDGSRAANRLGWQWTTGVGSAKVYGFSRWQVEKRAPRFCRTCPRADDCPIEDWPADPAFASTPAAVPDSRLVGPLVTARHGDPEAVWLTAESLGRSDTALVANPDLRVVFVFDEPLLARLRLSAKRLGFLIETLAEMGAERDLEVRLGDPVRELEGIRLAVTHAPVPGFVDRADRLDLAEIHPWMWLAAPTAPRVSSFSAWRKGVEVLA
jgi:deoxyribodipyrimidine photo-lyase